MDKYEKAMADTLVSVDETVIRADIEEILSKHLEENRKPEVLKQLFNCIDLTTLKSTDSEESVRRFTERVNAFEEEYPELPNVAAICVYPNFVPVVRTALDVSEVEIASVAGCFPTAQSFLEVKIAEIGMAVASGADEIDVVFGLGDYLDGDYQKIADDLVDMKHSCRDSLMKVILETGALKTPLDIRNASILSMYSGADFIKTSTGKEYPGASLEAAYVMMRCIKEYADKFGRKVGFKASGGISTTEDALKYYTLGKAILGDEWVGSNELFRIGASRLANNLLKDILGDPEIKFF